MEKNLVYKRGYIVKVLETLLFMLRNPIPRFTIISIILGLISSYQEARGTVKGIAKEAEAWTKWYQRQTEAKIQGYTLAEVPPSLKTA